MKAYTVRPSGPNSLEVAVSYEETAGHSPAPWKAHRRDGGTFSSPMPEIRSGDTTIATIQWNGHNQAHGEANARLIAAAPELLLASKDSIEFIGQALEFLYEQFYGEEMEDDTPDELLEAFDSAGYGSSKGELYRIVAQLKRVKATNEQAIAKATGGV